MVWFLTRIKHYRKILRKIRVIRLLTAYQIIVRNYCFKKKKELIKKKCDPVVIEKSLISYR